MILVSVYPGNTPHSLVLKPHSYSEAARAIYASMPGLQWDKSRKIYTGDRVAVEAVARTLEDARLARVERSAQKTSYADDPVPLQHVCAERLHDYQRRGAAWIRDALCDTDAALLADGMGLGKTAQAIVGVESACTQPHVAIVVVCPAVVKPQWRKEVKRWSADAERALDPASGSRVSYFIYSYEGFVRAAAGKPAKGDTPLPDVVHVLVLDEIHYISNGRAKRSRAIAAWCKSHPDTLRLGLSGTPMTTRPRDLWHVMDVLYPKAFGSYFAYTRRYCGGSYVTIRGLDEPVWQADGASNLDELGARLELYMLRRVKSDVSAELPQRTRVCVDVEMPRGAKKSLQRALGAVNLTDAPVGVSALLSEVETYKIDAACELAETCLASGRRPLVLTTRKASAESIATRLGAALATGDDAPHRRAELLQAGDGAGVATVYSVTTGIDLVAYDTIIFTGLDWVPSTLLQAEARIDRLSQKSSDIVIYYLVGIGTLDEVVQNRVIERLEFFETAIGREDSGLRADFTADSDESLLATLVTACKESTKT